MKLESFLKNSSQSHAREEILNHKLLFDLKIAAGECNYHLRNYYSDVDHDGFDVVLDDGITLRKVQLKSVGSKARAAKWDIHRGLLRPAANNLEAFGFQYKSTQFDGGKICWGAEGGVVLIVYGVDGSNISVRYFYTDIYIVSAISLGVLRKNTPTVKVANNIRRDLPKSKANSKLVIRKGLFVEAASPGNLLCLLGLTSRLKQNWQSQVRALASEKWGPKGEVLAAKLKEYRKDLPSIFKELCGSSIRKPRRKK